MTERKGMTHEEAVKILQWYVICPDTVSGCDAGCPMLTDDMAERFPNLEINEDNEFEYESTTDCNAVAHEAINVIGGLV
jgi:hypothetical protein